MKIDLVSLAMLMALGGLVDAIPTPDKGRHPARGGDHSEHGQVGAGGAAHGAYGAEAGKGVEVVEIAGGKEEG
ncbi:hypothetical protein DL770_007520 [Monosporascus sp. CRB-9-2]|nr:hypothetical protein DL770_007520 [Monosporascus sp. CRB-9-2]